MSLILIMGIPASGKSTFRRKITNSALNLIASTSFDDFRVDQSLENARETRKLFQNHVESEIFQTDRPIWLVEDVFYLQSMRRAFQKVAKRRGFQFGVVFMKIDLETSIFRNSRRKSGKQSEETIRKMFEAMEEPVEVENRVVLDGNDSEDVAGIQELLRVLKLTMMMIPDVPQISNVSESKNAAGNPNLHAESLDVLTRRLVSEVMKSGGFDGRKLSEARKRLLNILNLQNHPQYLQNPSPLRNQLIDIYNAL